ncbi:hypothetical protein [Chryseosolibacter indicus]|uniref:Uncharacterized protein n=1 Tax=Chryseosolibacter indicus TaxID=2782351 RepID=A0ABS5VXS6_9BACT|nr:hypothetical protein [Chryseosolibacter indicus]MBT1705559.1 hypothetical protein [Chryseosolibacter indicus]
MDYYQGYEDAMRQARVSHSAGLLGFVIRTIISILYSAFVYAPLLIFSYFLVNKMSALYSNDVYIKVGLTVIVAYFLFSFVYLLKGVLIGLRTNGQRPWILVWAICVISACGIQAIIGQNLLETFFRERNIANYDVWSWIGGSATLILIYSHYQFLSNVAPRSVFWSYRLGFLSVRKKAGTFDRLTPKKSDSYFQNAQMKVSHRKLG